MRITGFKSIAEDGHALRGDAFGNNAAINCPACGHSILFVALENQKGSSESHPATCIGCKKSYYIEVPENRELIIVREKH